MAFLASLGIWAGGIIALILVIGIPLAVSLFFRTVVPTNEVHVVQRRRTTIPYGRDKEQGNVYFKWPEWIPFIGITTMQLPVSIFDTELIGYEAYDIGRAPFKVDVIAFFKVDDPETAAQRVQDFRELKAQLVDILRGAVRKILASADIEEIMEGRGRFGQEFTDEVKDQLKAWGVSTVKNIEFMDITDGNNTQVIADIMAKKTSAIERESRVEVADNKMIAQNKETEAGRDVELVKQEAAEQVGKRTAEKDKTVGIANEQAQQDIKEQAKVTAEKDMAVKKVEQEKQADIDKNVAVIVAEQNKTVKQKDAEAGLIEKEREADGILVVKQKDAEGILAVGTSEAEAERLMQMASVTPQIELAHEIGENPVYQQYLIGTKGLEVGQVVGVAKAQALTAADIKVIANAGDAESGVDKVMDIFTSKGGTKVGAMLEALKQTEAGKDFMVKYLGAENFGPEKVVKSGGYQKGGEA